MAAYQSFLLIIAGLTGIYSITTVSKVSVKTGSSITIPCLYEPQYESKVKYLCKGYYWTSCSYAIKTNQANSRKFLISDDKTRRILTVTIKNLTDTDTGYYWCAVEINGGSDAGQYFHLSVNRGLYVDPQEFRAVNGGNKTIHCRHHNVGGANKWCKLGTSCVTGSAGSIGRATVAINATVSDVFTVTMSGLRIENSGWYWCAKGDLQMPVHIAVNEQSTTDEAPTTAQGEQRRVPFHLQSIIIPLSLLVFLVIVALFIWFMLRRHKQTEAESAITMPEEEVTYSDIKHERKYPCKTPGVQNDVDVVYSTVVVTKQ